MSMASCPLFSANFLSGFSKRPTNLLLSYQTNHPAFSSLQCNNKKRDFPLPKVASIPYQPPINVDYLEGEFSGHGVTFEDVNGSCVAKMVLENGSAVSLMLPSGLITSYKAPMWHGGIMELLHTIVCEGKDDDALIQGGVSLAFSCGGSENEVPWSLCNWSLLDIRGNSQDSVQVELISRDGADMADVRYIVTLDKSALSSELVVLNTKSSSLQLTGSFLSHLTVSTPDATYAIGLEGSDFFDRAPFSSNFVIVPPENSQENKFGLGQLWSQMRFLSGLGATNEQNADEANSTSRESVVQMDGEEDDNYKQLTEKMSRYYTSAPTNFTVIDRGRRNSVVAGRHGLNELYLFSPGSRHAYYSKYAYICIGASAMLKPIILEPGDVWRSGQQLHNPNM